MIDASGILSIIDKKSAPAKNILFGTISSDLKVIFDGETQPSQKTIARIQYTPVAGDRVAIYKQGQICIILGKLGDGVGGGDTSEIYRQRIIQDILAINQPISLDATWDTIDFTIRHWFISGPLVKSNEKVVYRIISGIGHINTQSQTGLQIPIPVRNSINIAIRDVRSNHIVLTGSVIKMNGTQVYP